MTKSNNNKINASYTCAHKLPDVPGIEKIPNKINKNTHFTHRIPIFQPTREFRYSFLRTAPLPSSSTCAPISRNISVSFHIERERCWLSNWFCLQMRDRLQWSIEATESTDSFLSIRKLFAFPVTIGIERWNFGFSSLSAKWREKNNPIKFILDSKWSKM